MKVGDIVVPSCQYDYLSCGSGIYTHAIVVSLDPFALVSEKGDMLWVRRKLESVVVLKEAIPSENPSAFERWESENEAH